MSKPAVPTSDQLCPAGSMLRHGPIEAHFICLLPQGHDGYHRDPEWGIWEEADDE